MTRGRHTKARAALPVSVALLLGACNVAFSTGGDGENALSETASASEAAATAVPPVTDADKTTADQFIRDIYLTFNRQDQDRTPAAAERPVFTRELAQLIGSVPHKEGEMGLLDDADWFCHCQDWDPATAGLTSLTSQARDDGKIEVTTSFLARSDGEASSMTFLLAREGGRWKIDDMTSIIPDTSLREAIATAVREDGGA